MRGQLPRLFVAIAMPPEVQDALDRLSHGFPDWRWTALDDLHLTLRYIGEVDHDTFYEIGELLAGVSLPPFDLELAGIGQFPPRGPLKQLWVGATPNEELGRLKRRVDRCVTGAGVPPDGRKFVPHVTAVRFRQPPPEHRLAAFLKRHSLIRLPPFPISNFALYSSVLKTSGAEHILEAEYDFVTGAMTRH